MRVVAGLLVLVSLAGCASDDTPSSSSPSPEVPQADYEAVQEDRWEGVDWTLYVAEQAESVCAEWTGVGGADTPVTYPSSIDLERRSCIERSVLSRAHGTVVQPMFTYRLPNDRVGVWGVTAPDAERVEVELESGEPVPSVVSVNGTFALLMEEGSQAGEVTAVLSDGTSIECTEPASLSDLAWTCR